MDSAKREERALEWDLGLRGAAYLLAMSGLVISEVFFGWATEEDLQPNIDGLSRDEVLLGILPGIVAVLFARRWGLRRHGDRRSRGAPKPA